MISKLLHEGIFLLHLSQYQIFTTRLLLCVFCLFDAKHKKNMNIQPDELMKGYLHNIICRIYYILFVLSFLSISVIIQPSIN